MIIIGLVGVKESGKSTVANIIKLYNGDAKEFALADKLKNTCSSVFDIPRINFDDQSLKEVPLSSPITLDPNKIGAILEHYGVGIGSRYIDSIFDACGTKLTSPRHIAQIVGTEILRNFRDSIHCESIKLEENKLNIISDVRFPNEYDFFSKKENFYPIYIHRSVAEAKVTEDSHASEKNVALFKDRCYMINNNGSLEATKIQLADFLDNLPCKAQLL